jgi:hypothetical protein
VDKSIRNAHAAIPSSTKTGVEIMEREGKGGEGGGK